ncbi:MAG: hypothetical protein A3A28_01845 [Candidatus Sungbacteria bacterium RIFCSPLOWO2_01_FULL_47_32]|uniref:DDH domain-containing protein n=1 Tax=Candidatus Sungbacteria bacterium RIFCSPHIGHO2_01_FULL_47_32 TaxID=1802264 RepID=A0A1G2K7Q5_9BACT|nr:MAG: Phosphoesterase RecJ domain protein [Parcubacteria group bacterium GW2011_GWA2_47_10]OGZ94500.1 MAG: hypothetical protein A2633_05390 [Candidatus Sungbacteria bacterium RIFCSPHIGHO2_01_FULL_47_32]OGZ98934.1 MAG: hypothetical protein A3D57_04360 [Candidatus Sungbacteria bacterium RIFCSPHIGHO2_02_FULL_46_12]OHA05092.1 MAG: hypothetical protein A3A28_01845 [Candidatus Sungbacteria bacterium RIFCSPLOWO2_01_FULL_47_32]
MRLSHTSYLHNQKFSEAYNLIKRSRHIILATHESPDGDGVASMLALYQWLESIKPGGALLYSKEPIPSGLAFLPESNAFRDSIPPEPFDLVIVFDYGDKSRLGLESWFKANSHIECLTFDHHPLGRHMSGFHLIDTTASSTAELVYDFFAVNGIDFSKDIARCLLTGILTDTGTFKHSNVTPHTLRVASFLLTKGVTTREIVRHTETNIRPLDSLRVWGEAILRTQLDHETGLAYSFFTANDFSRYGIKKEYLDGFSSLLSAIPESRAAVLLTEHPEEPGIVRGSLRSEYHKKFNVSETAKKFGGGGHALASSFRVEATLDDVIERLLKSSKTV